MPDGISQIAAKIDPGKHDVHVLPVMHAENHAIGRSAVYAESFKFLDRRTLVGKRPPTCNRMTCRRLLAVGRDNANLAKLRGDLSERHNAGAIDAVII